MCIRDRKEALESKDRFEKEYGNLSFGIFIRKIIGLDIEAANKHFSTFIQSENLTPNQITFVQKIIDYLNINGVLEKQMLTQSPFTDQNDEGVMGVFGDEDTKIFKVIQLVEEVNKNAGIA